jgi:hypothetical protein
VSMPETPMHEHYSSVFRQHDVWSPGQSGASQSVTEAPLVESLADKDFQLGVRASDPRHLRGSLLGRQDVCQDQAFVFFFEVLVALGGAFRSR